MKNLTWNMGSGTIFDVLVCRALGAGHFGAKFSYMCGCVCVVLLRSWRKVTPQKKVEAEAFEIFFFSFLNNLSSISWIISRNGIVDNFNDLRIRASVHRYSNHRYFTSILHIFYLSNTFDFWLFFRFIFLGRIICYFVIKEFWCFSSTSWIIVNENYSIPFYILCSSKVDHS